MKIMLPYYNDLTVLLSTVFKALGFEIDYTGKPGKKTIELATKYAPESWCFDIKSMFGQALEALERNDDIIIMPGAWRKNNTNCLLGCLTEGIMKKKLEKISKKKFHIWFFNINPAEIMLSGYTAAFKNLSQLKKYSKINFFRSKLLKAILLGTKKMKMVSKIKEIVLNSPDVVESQKLFLILDNLVENMIYNADDKNQAQNLFMQAKKQIKELKRKKISKKITLGIVGDYSYTLFSDSPFFDIEKFLVSEGIYVNQPLSFFNYYSFLSPLYSKENRKKQIKMLKRGIGGSEIITILSSVYLKNKVDGLIHIRTFSCTPEEVANEILTSNKEKFPPILSLSYDAHTTEENLKVRIEAFIDMLRMKNK